VPRGERQDFRDERVCKDFLLGLCPHTLFTNTKDDLGECPGIHDDELKRKYETAAKSHDFGYERAHVRKLEGLIADAERRIARGRQRTDDDGDAAAIPRIDVDRAPELLEITKEIEEKVKASEVAGEAAEVDKAQRLLEEAEGLRRKKTMMQAALVHKSGEAAAARGGGNKQRLRVCDICGAFLSLNDSDDRLADHFGGRIVSRALPYVRLAFGPPH
jgi:RNA-binding protein Luc7-like 2